MTWLCKIGLHRWRPVKVFTARYVNREGVELMTRVAIKGYRCRNCRSRNIRCESRAEELPELLQKAYNWLNEVPSRPARVLNLVKR